MCGRNNNLKKLITLVLSLFMTVCLFGSVIAEDSASASTAENHAEGLDYVDITGDPDVGIDVKEFEYATEEAKKAAADYTLVGALFEVKKSEEADSLSFDITVKAVADTTQGQVELATSDYKLPLTMVVLKVTPKFAHGDRVSVEHYHDGKLVKTYGPLTVVGDSVTIENKDGFSTFKVIKYVEKNNSQPANDNQRQIVNTAAK